MQRTQLPYWISPAPAKVGSSQTGKLSADQWRTTATIHLAITMVRLWGPLPAEDHRHKMLENFMDLVTATKLATMRTMYTSRINEFNLHMKRYLDNVLILYPAVKLTPNQHLSLHHGYDILPIWGPSHGYRGWITERMNYKLQKIPTNKKFGERMSRIIKSAPHRSS
jgi:hypothetical protein